VGAYGLLRPLLFALDAERAHRLVLAAASARHALAGPLAATPSLPTRAMGLDFPNPVGLAAGLDKDGRHLAALAGMGFGFIEVGTVTPRPQPGNPRPRLFRLPRQEALINRMGFNNDGVDALVARLQRHRATAGAGGCIVGVNVGRNKDTAAGTAVAGTAVAGTAVADAAAADYCHCLARVHGCADYVTVNVSSPNTPGLRALEAVDALDALLAALADARRRAEDADARRVPMLVKLSPDLDVATLPRLVEVLVVRGIDGVIATNTTLARPQVADEPVAAQAGGLSGRPLGERADAVLERLAAAAGAALPIVASGGVADAAAVRRKFALGATLVQLYTGLVYRGPALVGDAVAAVPRTGNRQHALA
jgi:dihydroorotate dehydrogenase